MLSDEEQAKEGEEYELVGYYAQSLEKGEKIRSGAMIHFFQRHLCQEAFVLHL